MIDYTMYPLEGHDSVTTALCLSSATIKYIEY